MKVSLLTLLLMFLSTTARAQLYVCKGQRCDVFDRSQNMVATFAADSMRIGQLPGYATEEIDSIVFTTPPQLVTRQLGWWGDLTNGTSSYRAHIETNNSLIFDVCFTFTAQEGNCLSAHCEVVLEEEWMVLHFLLEATSENDPYIYVKETLTGPRKFETWVMGDPVLPASAQWKATDELTLQADCTLLLTGRPMEEVRQIIEAWLHQEGTIMYREQ